MRARERAAGGLTETESSLKGFDVSAEYFTNVRKVFGEREGKSKFIPLLLRNERMARSVRWVCWPLSCAKVKHSLGVSLMSGGGMGGMGA